MVGTSVAVVLSGALLIPTGAARADEIGATKVQIQALEAAATAGARQIHQLTLTYNQDSFQAAVLASQVTADERQLAQLEARVTSSRYVLREDAIISYTGGAGLPPGVSLSGTSDPSVRAEYLEVAAGDISDAVDQYRTEERRLRAAEVVLAREQQASQSAAIATAAIRTEALAAASNEQHQLGVLQARLTSLQAAAAAAARRPPVQGLPVDNGIVSAVQAVVSGPSSGAGGVWLQLRQCESSNNYRANTGNGFYGAYQFSESTWQNLGYPGRPDLEPAAMQDQAAQRLQREAGWSQWPACAAALGLD